jgi:hypothetical protein
VAEPIADAPFEKMLAFEEELVVVSATECSTIDKRGHLPAAMVGDR